MSQNKSNICPNCGGKLKAWADLDTQMNFDIGAKGALKLTEITNNLQSDGRAGIDCQKCDWKVHYQDLNGQETFFEKVIIKALDASCEVNTVGIKSVN